MMVRLQFTAVFLLLKIIGGIKVLNKLMQSRIREEKGSALVMVLIVFLVVMILGTSVIFVFSTNLTQAKHQQDSMEAYYLSYSGIEMAFAALVADGNEKLNQLTRASNPVAEHRETDIRLGNGKVTVVAKKATDAEYVGWIEIESTAKLTRNDITYVRSMVFNPVNPTEMVWINN